MRSFDANILIYSAFLSNPAHKRIQELISQSLSSDQGVALCWEVLHAFRRISTNILAFKPALSTDEADDYVDQLVNHPNVRILTPSLESWQVFKRYSAEMKITGNLVTDAVIASQLEANGVKKLYSNDRDFRKFDYLRVIDPFAKKRRR